MEAQNAVTTALGTIQSDLVAVKDGIGIGPTRRNAMAEARKDAQYRHYLTGVLANTEELSELRERFRKLLETQSDLGAANDSTPPTAPPEKKK